MMPLPWPKKTSEKIATYPVFHLRKDVLVSPRTGTDLTAYILETRDWVNIIPLTSDNQIVMVRQYRFAVEETTLEIPGGLIDKNDPSPLQAARREMREETGYDSEQVEFLGSCRPNPAILNNTCHMFCARNVQKKWSQNMDEGEDIQVELVPLDQLPILVRENSIRHSLVLNAFYLFDLMNKSKHDK